MVNVFGESVGSGSRNLQMARKVLYQKASIKSIQMKYKAISLDLHQLDYIQLVHLLPSFVFMMER